MWVDPIFDRIQSDLNKTNGKGYLNATDLNRIEGNCEHLKMWMIQYGYTSPPMIFKTWVRGYLVAPEVDRIRTNVKGLSQAFYTFAPDIIYHDTLNYTDVNTLEELMNKVNDLIGLMINSFTKKSGTFQSGQEVIL